MAKQKVKGMVGVVLALVIAGILVGYVLPIGIGAVNTPNNVTLTQDVNTQYQVDQQLYSNVTAVTDGTDATIELNDTSSDTQISKTVNVGATETYSLPGGDVNVTVDSASTGSPDTAQVTYEVPNDFGWGDGATSLFGLLPLFLVLVPLVVVVGWAMRSM